VDYQPVDETEPRDNPERERPDREPNHENPSRFDY
jgi:hypothetical protein